MYIYINIWNIEGRKEGKKRRIEEKERERREISFIKEG